MVVRQLEDHGATLTLITARVNDGVSKGDVTRDDSRRRFLAQHSAAMLEKCCNHSKQCRNNVEMMCCIKNSRCKSACVTSPVTSKVVLTFESMRLWAKFYGITIHLKPLSKNFQMVLFVFRHFTQ